MIKNFVKTISVTIAVILVLTGCAEKKENAIIDESTASTTENTTSEDKVEDTTSTEIESKTEVDKPVSSSKVEDTTSTTTTSKTEETSKPSSTATSSSTTTSTTTTSTSSSSKPSSSSSSNSSKPSSSTTTSSSKPTEKPVEEPVKTHDCSVDGHVWESFEKKETGTFQEMHIVYDHGFDATLARRYFPELENPYLTFKATMESLGSDGVAGSASTIVEVEGVATYKYEKCKFCNDDKVYTSPEYIEPTGEWHFVNNKNLRWDGFDTVIYDPINIPQEFVDKVNNYILSELGLI